MEGIYSISRLLPLIQTTKKISTLRNETFHELIRCSIDEKSAKNHNLISKFQKFKLYLELLLYNFGQLSETPLTGILLMSKFRKALTLKTQPVETYIKSRKRLRIPVN